MESKKIINKIMQIMFILVMIIMLTTIVSADKIDDKNELILQKLLEVDNISVNNIEILDSHIFVSIEVTEAMDYDTELISFWGSIFGISAMLKNDNTSYSTVTIENLIDGESYMYISTNVASIEDYQNDLIEDHEFWEESLVTAEKPTIKQIVDATYLPSESLNETKKSNIFNIVYLFWLFIIIILAILIYIAHKNKLLSKSKSKFKKINVNKFKTHYKEKIKPKTKKVSHHIKKKSKGFLSWIDKMFGKLIDLINKLFK